MASEKAVSGQPDWAVGPYEGALRWLAPLSIDGVTSSLNLCIDSYPSLPYLRFHINLIYEKSICRLDFWENDRHDNRAIKGVSIPPTVDLGWIYGPHFHGWTENRMLASFHAGPKELGFAIPLNAGIRSFDSAFRYFCGECEIVFNPDQTPVLPPRDYML